MSMGRSGASAKKASAPGWGGRIATMLFSGLFMLAFGAGGLAGGVVPIALTLWRAVEVAGWQPVSAQVLEVTLGESRGSKGGSTYAVRARYTYRANGQDHVGDRVGLLEWGSDNVGTWHQDWHARLEDARRSEQPVAAWFDPARPERSILDRRVRGGLMLFFLPFAVLFTAVGVGAGVVFWRALTGRGDGPRAVAASGARAARTGGRAAAAAGGGLAPGVRGRLDHDAGIVEFRRWWPRVMAGVMGLMLLMALAVQPPLGIAGRVVVAACATAWIALAAHLATLRWTWQRHDSGLRVERTSWMRTRCWVLDRAALARVQSVLAFTSRTGNGPEVQHHRLEVRQPDGKTLALTPALAGPEALAAVRAHLKLAQAPAQRHR